MTIAKGVFIDNCDTDCDGGGDSGVDGILMLMVVMMEMVVEGGKLDDGGCGGEGGIDVWL